MAVQLKLEYERLPGLLTGRMDSFAAFNEAGFARLAGPFRLITRTRDTL